MAVADDQQQLDHMVTAFTLAGSLRGEESEAQYFYTGHTTGERETGWETDGETETEWLWHWSLSLWWGTGQHLWLPAGKLE